MSWTKYEGDDSDDDTYYRLSDQEPHTIVPLPRGAFLAVQIDDEAFKIEFALFDDASGDAEGNVLYKMVMHGEGYGGNLRECRHTWWGEPDNQGYIFYPNFEVITAALEALKTWFEGK